MAKTRQEPTKQVREQVEKEFNHRCAICGESRFQLHHIDNNPSNNDPLNLIPLCPNHHLIDQHDPTRKMDPDRLRMFRVHKDPVILWPQFYPLFKRLSFLDHFEDDLDQLEKQQRELTSFIRGFEMGNFYADKINQVLRYVEEPGFGSFSGDSASVQAAARRRNAKLLENQDGYRRRLNEHREEVHELVVEMLRYQKWVKPE